MKVYKLKEEIYPAPLKKFKIDYRKELNASQLEAVEATEGSYLVIAGAGSGKTRTLIYRLARLIETGIGGESILLLTFTRKASQEMLRRAASLIDYPCERVSGGTFHSFANMILRRYSKFINFQSNFTILDRSDSEDAINLLKNQLNLNTKEKRFPRKDTIQNIFSMSINRNLSIESIIEKDYSHFTDHIDDLKKLKEAYSKYKLSNFLMDYDDLLVCSKKLLEENEEIRNRLSNQYRFIMVDEYQDTNEIQAEIAKLLCSAHKNIMVVGDDSQSIYSFRGASFRNIMDFPNRFPDVKIIKLEENYRSTQPILGLTNEIIREAKEKYTKVLFTRKIGGTLPALIVASDEYSQSKFVVQKIMELREEGIPLNEIAVLFRSSHLSFDLEIELNRRDIPYAKYGGFKFIETAHVKDILAHLRVIINPRDIISWNRLLLLVEGVGPKTTLDIIISIKDAEKSPLSVLEGFTGNRSKNGIKKLVEVLNEITDDNMTPAEKINSLIKYYTPILTEKHDDYPKRLKDLEHLLMITERYKNIEDFLNDMVLEPPDERKSVSDIVPEDKEDELLVLSTIHSAKGLEWHSVFIIWALEGVFPSSYSYRSEEEIEEERRLMYVAATRAKCNLFITYPVNIFDHSRGAVLSKPSRFIDNIPQNFLEPWTLVDEESM